MSRFDPLFAGWLAERSAHGMARSLRPVTPFADRRIWRDGRELIDFSSNDYLGLARHPKLIERSIEWTEKFGAGSGASRLVTGTLELHKSVEAKIAKLKGTKAALIFTSGWQANAAILPALFDRKLLGADAAVFTDRLNHASLHDGCRAAGQRETRFRHNDLGHLEELLTTAPPSSRRFIVTESVFSMDGDRADVATLADIAERHDAFLYLDEAHATGALGPHGVGLSALAPGRIDLIMGTFSKALGGFGAYVAGSHALIDYLINQAGGFIYTTALPPAVLGAMDAALDLLPSLDAERTRLAALADRLREGLNGLGFDTCGSTTQIVPAVIGSAEAAVAASKSLEEAGLLAIAIRPPTVPAGTSRIRFALSCAHTDEELDRLLAAMAKIAR
jgi:8-amino-7-oxononanoate synthase